MSDYIDMIDSNGMQWTRTDRFRLVSEENVALRERVKDLENDLGYAYRVIDFGFTYSSFDLSILRARAKEWVEADDARQPTPKEVKAE